MSITSVDVNLCKGDFTMEEKIHAKGRRLKKWERKRKKKKVYSCRVGDQCPACRKDDAIVSGGTMRTALGDGMAGMANLNPEILHLPLECRYCGERFKKAPTSALLLRPLSAVIRILFGMP